MKVSFVNITAEPEQTMAYIARVSNPNNQENENYAGLLRYCIKPVSYTHLTLPTSDLV